MCPACPTFQSPWYLFFSSRHHNDNHTRDGQQMRRRSSWSDLPSFFRFNRDNAHLNDKQVNQASSQNTNTPKQVRILPSAFIQWNIRLVIDWDYQMLWLSLHKKWSFLLRISSVTVTKSAVFCGNSFFENFIFCAVHQIMVSSKWTASFIA